jgi:hypothetical protein
MSRSRRDANRRNAKFSTGPKTESGKAVSRLNATRHGLLSPEVVLAREDRTVFEAWAAEMRTDLAPQGALERLLVDQVIAAAWRLRRMYKLERPACEPRSRPLRGEFYTELDGPLYQPDELLKLCRYGTTIERSFYRALHELQRHQAVRHGAEVPPPVALDLDVEVSGPGAQNSDGFVS